MRCYKPAICFIRIMKSITFNDGDNFPDIFADRDPVLVNVVINPNQKIYPKLEFGNSLEHMFPFIDLDELKSEMIVEVPERKKRNGWVIQD